MDIPFRVEGQEFKDIKAQAEQGSAERLVCTSCSFQLELPSSAAAKVCCPRCNTWVDVDPSCFGSCIKCHKTRKGDESACTTTSLANSKETGEISLLVKGKNSLRTFFAKFGAFMGKARGYMSGNKSN